MDIQVTMIVPASRVDEARAIAGGFTTALSADGKAPATHYVSSGWVPADVAEQVQPLCSTYATDSDGMQVITEAGLALCNTSD